MLHFLAEGPTAGPIGRRLFEARSTIEARRRNVMRERGLHTVADPTRYAVREGLPPLDS